jgi:DNA-binding protein H-NS
MTTLADLIKQKQALEAQIAQARQKERSAAIDQVKALAADHDLTAQDIFGGARRGKAAGAATRKVAPKYRDPATSMTWTGRGKAPVWIAGKDRSRFLIA